MDTKAISKNNRISPIKVRLIVDLVRGKSVEEAKIILTNYNTKAAKIVKKTLDSAIANAVNNNKLDETKLYISDIRGDMGTTLKRHMPGSRGKVDKNYHRRTHVTVVVSER
jgi:ribosomal protein L22, bacterial type